MSIQTQIKEALPWLEHGDIADAAKKAGITPQHASRIINDKVKKPNSRFLNILLDKALKIKTPIVSKQNTLHKLQLIG